MTIDTYYDGGNLDIESITSFCTKLKTFSNVEFNFNNFKGKYFIFKNTPNKKHPCDFALIIMDNKLFLIEFASNELLRKEMRKIHGFLISNGYGTYFEDGDKIPENLLPF